MVFRIADEAIVLLMTTFRSFTIYVRLMADRQLAGLIAIGPEFPGDGCALSVRRIPIHPECKEVSIATRVLIIMRHLEPDAEPDFLIVLAQPEALFSHGLTGCIVETQGVTARLGLPVPAFRPSNIARAIVPYDPVWSDDGGSVVLFPLKAIFVGSRHVAGLEGVYEQRRLGPADGRQKECEKYSWLELVEA